jgi:hypothetical protein
MQYPMLPPFTDVEHFTSPAPRMPVLPGSPPQQSASTRHRSPSTWHPCACWQIATPVGPQGAQRSLQQPPAQPICVGSQSVPSTPVQLVPPALGGRPHVPGFVGETGLALGELQTPPQQLAPSKQMSPFCTQYELAMLQRWFVQSPEQQSEPALHAFPAVVHAVTVPPSPVPPSGAATMGAHAPFSQCWVQQTLPATGQAAPMVRHCEAPQWPATHESSQQSVFTEQASPALPQTETEYAHALFRQR